MPQVVHVNIDCDWLVNLAHVGVRRAAIFMGLGFNGVHQEGFRDYELHKLPPGDNAAYVPPDILPRNASDETVGRYKEEFSTWITGCGLREMLEHYGLMLDHMHKFCLVVAQSRGFLAQFGNPERLQFKFTRHGVPGKHANLRERFQVEGQFTPHVDAFYFARNALTHGLGIVRPEDAESGTLRLRWLAMEMHARGGDTGSVMPIRDLMGARTSEELEIQVKVVARERCFAVGQKIDLSSQDLSEICLFVTVNVIPKSLEAFIGFLRQHNVEGASPVAASV